MADYYAKTCTNYFSVTDENKFRKLMSVCEGNGDSIEVYECCDEPDKKMFCFCCDGSILGLPAPLEDISNDFDFMNYVSCEDEHDFDIFCNELQKLLAADDAIIITEVGSEKLRYLVGVSTIITNKEIRIVNLHAKAIEVAREMLGNDNYTV